MAPCYVLDMFYLYKYKFLSKINMISLYNIFFIVKSYIFYTALAMFPLFSHADKDLEERRHRITKKKFMRLKIGLKSLFKL